MIRAELFVVFLTWNKNDEKRTRRKRVRVLRDLTGDWRNRVCPCISKCLVSSCVGLPHQGKLIESRYNICYSGLLTSPLCCNSTYRRIGSMSIGLNLIYFVNRCEEMWGAYWNYDCLILRTTFSVFYIAFAAQFVVYQERYISGRVPQVGDDIHRVGCTVRGGILTSVDCRWMRADIGELHYTDWTYYFFFHV